MEKRFLVSRVTYVIMINKLVSLTDQKISVLDCKNFLIRGAYKS